MSNARQSALHAQSMGRHGDTILMHINEKELLGLAGLGKITGHNITINPETGLPEAFSFGKLLPWILGAAAIALTAGAATPAVAAAEGAAAAGTGVAAAATPAIAAAGATAGEAALAGTAASAVPAAVGGAASTAGGIGALGGSAATMTPEAIAAANAAATAPIAYTPLAAPIADSSAIVGGAGNTAIMGAGGTDGLAAATQAAAPVESGFAAQAPAFDSSIAGPPDLSAFPANNAVNAAGSGGAYSPEALQTFTSNVPAAEEWGAKGLRWAGDAADWAIEHPTQTAMGLSMVQSLMPGPKQKGEEEYDPRKHPMKSMPYGQTKNARYSSPGAGYNASYEHSFFPGYNAFNGYEEGGPVAPAHESGGGVQEFLAGLQANAGSPADFIAQLASNPKTRTLLPMIEQIMKGTQPQRINRQSSMDTPVEQRRGYAGGGSVLPDQAYWEYLDRRENMRKQAAYPMQKHPLLDEFDTRPSSPKQIFDDTGRLVAVGGLMPISNEEWYARLADDARVRANMKQSAYPAQKHRSYADGGAVAPQSGSGYGYSKPEAGGQGRGFFGRFGQMTSPTSGMGSKGTQDQGSPAAPPVGQPQPFSINTDQWVSDFGPGAVNRMGYTPSQTPGWRSQMPVNNGPLVMRQPTPFNAPPIQQQGPIFNQRPMIPAVNQMPTRRGKVSKIQAWRDGGYRGSAFAEGGEVMDGIHPDEQAGSDQVVAAVIQAIQEGGQSPESQQAIAAFVQMFGQAALTDLIKRVQAMGNQSPYRAPDGSLSGPGDGQSDSIPAMIDGQAPAALSTGEHVIDKLTVDAAGGGDNAAGHDALNKIKEGLRTQAYGAPQLPQPGNVNRILRG